jgi:hypothetical protein
MSGLFRVLMGTALLGLAAHEDGKKETQHEQTGRLGLGLLGLLVAGSGLSARAGSKCKCETETEETAKWDPLATWVVDPTPGPSLRQEQVQTMEPPPRKRRSSMASADELPALFAWSSGEEWEITAEVGA